MIFDAEQFDQILKEHNSQTTSAYSARIVELERNLTNLKGANSVQSTDIIKLTEEKSALQAEIAELRKKQQTVRGREGKAEKREADKVVFWRVAGPLINRLIAEAEPGARYNRRQIQSAFLQELEKFPELKPSIHALSVTANEEDKTPFSRDNWGIQLIRHGLGDLAQKEPGRKADKSGKSA